MRAMRFAAALLLSAGLALSAGSAFAGGENDDTLNTSFSLADTKCDDSNEPISNQAEVSINGGENGGFFGVFGEINGTGTQGDGIEISYNSDVVNSGSANSKSGKVSQNHFAELCIFINDEDVDDGGRDTLVGGDNARICTFVEKCSVKGSVTAATSKKTLGGTANVNCSGTDLYSILTSDQVTSIEAAFPKGNKCGVVINANDPGKKSSLTIKLNQKSEKVSVN